MNVKRWIVVLAAALCASLAASAFAWNRLQATQFATLPPGTAHPEGITADSHGNFYVADFDVSGNTSVGTIVVFNHNGRLLRTLQVNEGSALLLGIAFNPVTGDLLVCDLGKSQVLKVDPQSGAASVFAAIPGSGGPNALAFDAAGNVYISDSFQATIWRTPKTGGAPTPWVVDPLLAIQGDPDPDPARATQDFPPFGANGLAFNNAASALFVANTASDRVIRIPLPNGPSGTPGTPKTFVNAINGADGLVIDGDDNLWVAANQADEIVVVDPTGKVIAKLGDFDGIDRQGAPIGLLFPASPVIVGGFVYVTNLSLDLHGSFGLPQAVDSQWAAQVTRHTIARLPAHIPPVRQ
ncbi:MAG TPA: SMP-30/gluconolactonase/LRE family protein [Casimicrobiaceae bacterium]|nr:SMP-30/gluconolactonase/LRE family protein [Casimicrobiaceae bacterium]